MTLLTGWAMTTDEDLDDDEDDVFEDLT